MPTFTSVKTRLKQIVTTHSGSLFGLCEDGSVWERTRKSNAGDGSPQYDWTPVTHPFEVSAPGDAELASWR